MLVSSHLRNGWTDFSKYSTESARDAGEVADNSWKKYYLTKQKMRGFLSFDAWASLINIMDPLAYEFCYNKTCHPSQGSSQLKKFTVHHLFND